MAQNTGDYKNLEDMLACSSEANEFFNALPDYIREMIQSRSQNVCSVETLRNYADNLLSGDK